MKFTSCENGKDEKQHMDGVSSVMETASEVSAQSGPETTGKGQG